MTHVESKFLAVALGVSERAVRIRANTERWPYTTRPCRGGHKRLFIFSSLPKNIQISLVAKEQAESAPQAPVPASPDELSEILHDAFDSRPATVKAEASSRLAAVRAYFSLVENGVRKTEARELTAKQFALSPVTLYRYIRDVTPLPESDWLPALAPGYAGRTATSELPAEAWDLFKADYLRLDAPNLSSCYQRIKKIASARGWAIPSERTFARAIEREIPESVLVFCRQGEKALLRLYPAQERDKGSLSAMEWINGDGYYHNVFVMLPDGTVGRPKTWFWQDVYSSKILAWRTDVSENTDQIRLAFLNLADRYGLPREITIDNTRAAANKWMTGGLAHRFRYKVKDEDPLGIFVAFGCKVHWATPAWGQAKPVERTFGVGGLGEYVDKDPACSGAWCGNNPTAKPENYASRAVPWAEFASVIERGVALWNSIDKRRSAVAAGRSYDQVFEESYARATVRKITAAQRRMLMLCAEAVKVATDGSIKMEAGRGYGVGTNRYWSQTLIDGRFAGKKVTVRFDPADLHADVHLYTMAGKYLGPATCLSPAGFGDTIAARSHNRERNRYKKATKLAAKAERQMTAIEMARHLPAQEPDAPPEAKVVELSFARAAGHDTETVDPAAAFANVVAMMRQRKDG